MTDAKCQRERYAEDPEYRERRLAYMCAWRRANRDRINTKQRTRYATDAEFRASERERARKRKRERVCRVYGITVQEFDALLARQEGACWICRRRFRSTPFIDHCHLTGWVRALLCTGCNSGLGSFCDYPAFLVRAGFFMQAWVQHLIDCFSEEENAMTSTKDDSNENQAGNLIRDAILKELQQPFGVAAAPPTNRLQAVARALVDKAEERDVAAIKEVFDCAGRKPPSALGRPIPNVLNVSWQNPLAKPKLANSQSAKPQSAKPQSAKPQSAKPQSSKPKPTAKASTTRRARDSSPPTSAKHASPAS
jgi:hypothetical protein